jgi:non-canonical purine NTP pyrophosphatase (RdgB/HAM1 family)
VARTKSYGRLIVEDVSLGFDELGNFPGPYVKWLLEAAGGRGLAAIAYALNNRAAIAQCCVGYWDGESARVFNGECAGEVLVQGRGENHFGWDAWFQPRGSNKTFAEMTPEEKDRVSHRGNAYRKLAAHLRQ